MLISMGFHCQIKNQYLGVSLRFESIDIHLYATSLVSEIFFNSVPNKI
jgi:hypothetical protein